MAKKEFEINANGELKRYCGPGGDVVIPEDAEIIGWGAFEDCIGLTSVVIPEGVTEIDGYAFYNCKNLRRVILPEGLEKIGGEAFWDCLCLEEINFPDSLFAVGSSAFRGCVSLCRAELPAGLTDIGEYAFAGCCSLERILLPAGLSKLPSGLFSDCSGLREVILPEKLTEVCYHAFSGCKSLSQIELPKGVQTIGTEAFSGCGSLAQLNLPQSLKTIGIGAFWGCAGLTSLTIPGEAQLTPFYMNDNPFAGCASLGEIQVDPENPYYTVQGGMLFHTFNKEKTTLLTWFGSGEQAVIPAWVKNIADGAFERRANLKEFAVEEGNASFRTDGRTLCRMDGSEAAAVGAPSWRMRVLEKDEREAKERREEKLAWAAEAKKRTGAQIAAQAREAALEAERKAEEEALEEAAREAERMAAAEKKLKAQVKKGVFMAGSDKLCPAEDLIRLIAKNSTADLDKQHIPWPPEALGAEAAAAGLDRGALLSFLEEKIFGDMDFSKKRADLFIPAYCRYAGEEQIERLIKQGKTWHSWGAYGAKGRKYEKCIQESLYLSDTKAAMRGCEDLDYYADIRDTDAQTLRDTVLAGLDLDSDGRICYDLGGRQVEAVLTDEMKISLYDRTAGKPVKSLPKKDASPEAYEEAKNRLSALKKDIKKLYAERRGLLFEAFLSGKRRRPAGWKQVYLGNPVFKKMAGLVVWSQEGVTFTIKDGAPVDASGTPVVLGEKSIRLAHPMEIGAEETAAWQNYFLSRGLKQLFAQMWEPVYRPEDILPDRYASYPMLLLTFQGQERHGIDFSYDYNTSEVYLTFKGCQAEWKAKGELRHNLDPNAVVTIGSFGFTRYTRQVNHIVSILDKWTIRQRIKEDDASMAGMLAGVTLAQIEEYLKLSVESQAANCTAALLEYKKEHFGDVDPMEEFVLE